MINAVKSEVFLVRKRPVGFVIGALWILLIVMFAYGIPFIIGKTLPNAADGATVMQVVAMPQFAATVLGSYPMFGGAVFLILGAALIGGDFGWGTWKVRFTQGPARTDVVVAKFLAGAALCVVIVTVTHLIALGTSAILSAAAGVSMALPGLGKFFLSWVFACLIAITSCWFGMALTVAFKSQAVALAAGLLWTLALENVVAGMALMWPSVNFIEKVLLGPAGGSLAHALGSKTMAQGGTPGVSEAHGILGALIVLTVYSAIALFTSTVLMNKRDIA